MPTGKEVAMRHATGTWFALGSGVLLALVLLAGFQDHRPATEGMPAATFVVQ